MPARWRGLWLLDTPFGEETAELEFVVIEDATIAVDVDANRRLVIEDSTLVRYSHTGVRFKGATTSSVSRTLIDGTPIAGQPRGLVGIHMKGGSVLAPTVTPTVTGCTITGNYWGVWLEGLGLAGTYGPNPTITGNQISGNSGTPPTNAIAAAHYCFTSGANLCMSGYTNAANVNATGNFWGYVDGADVRASIINASSQHITAATGLSQSIHGAAANFSGFLNQFGGTAVNGSVWSSSGFTRVTHDKSLLSPATGGRAVAIQFTAALALTSVSVKIYPENDDARSQLIKEICPPVSMQAGEQRTCTWDGRDPLGAVVPWEAYRYVITGTPVGGGPVVTFDPPRSANHSVMTGDQVVGDTADGCLTADPFASCPTTVPGDPLDPDGFFNLTVDLAKNEYFHFDYTVKAHPYTHVNHAVRARMEVYEGADAYTSSIKAVPITFPILPSFSGQTLNVVSGKWDGRDAQGVPIEGTHAIVFQVPDPLRPNSIIVKQAASRVQSVSASPYLIYHSYDQLSTLGFTLEKAAKVNVHILPPGHLDLGSAVETIVLSGTCAGNTLCAGPHTFTWNGQPSGGDSNRRNSVEDGVYSFAVEALEPANPAQSSILRGTIQVRQ